MKKERKDRAFDVKKLIVLLLAFVLTAAPASCGRKESGPAAQEPPGTAAQTFDDAAAGIYGSGVQALETGDSIYYVVSPMGVTGRPVVYVSDRELHDWMPLCARPDCMHRTSDCNAWFEGTGNCILTVCGEYIYYMFEPVHGLYEYVPDEDMFEQVWRMKLDGSEHELAAKFFPEDGGVPGMSSASYSLLGNYAILEWLHSYGEDLSSAETEYYVIDLAADEPQQKKVVFEGLEGLVHPLLLAGRGSTVYGAIGVLDGEDPEPSTLGTKILKIDLEACEAEELAFLENTKGFLSGELIGEKLCVIDGETGDFFAIDTETGETERRGGLLPGREGRSFWFFGSFFFGTEWDEEGTKASVVYDMNGDLLHRIEYASPEEAVLYGRMVGDIVFGYSCDPTDKAFERQYMRPPDMYLDMREIGTERFGWHEF